MYSEQLLHHFRNPRQVGELPPPAVTVEVTNPACGDILRLSIHFDGERAREARFRVRGCTAAIAAGSALAEWIAGRHLAELRGLTAADVEAAVGGLAAESKHAAILCVDGVRQALKAAQD